MYEVLKKLQDGQARVIETQADHSRQLLVARGHQQSAQRQSPRSRKLEVLFEDEYFRWVVNQVLRRLEEEKVVFVPKRDSLLLAPTVRPILTSRKHQ